MLSEDDGGAGAGESQVGAVKCAKTNVIELVAVFSNEPFRAPFILPNPLFEPLLDFFLLVASGLRCRNVHHVPIALLIVVVNCGRAEIQRVFEEVQGAATVRAPLDCVGDAVFRGPAATKEPQANLWRVAHLNASLIQEFLRKA